jgi:hypothetical protein
LIKARSIGELHIKTDYSLTNQSNLIVAEQFQLFKGQHSKTWYGFVDWSAIFD